QSSLSSSLTACHSLILFKQSVESVVREFFERADDDVGVEFAVGGEDADGAHPRATRGLRARGRVLYYDAGRRLYAELRGRREEDLRRRLTLGNVLCRGDRIEEVFEV